MAKDKATPRFSIFRSKRMKGWWPLIKLKSQEDIEREEREAEEERKKKRKKKKKGSKRSKMKPEDLQFVDSSGNTYLLMVNEFIFFACMIYLPFPPFWTVKYMMHPVNCSQSGEF